MRRFNDGDNNRDNNGDSGGNSGSNNGSSSGRYINYGFDTENDMRDNWPNIPNLAAAFFAVFMLLLVYGFLKYPDFSKQQINTGDTTPGTVQDSGQQAGLTDIRKEIRQLAEVRKNIIDGIVKKAAGLKLSLDIDMNTGAVRFSEGLFFDTNSEKINSKGEEYLKKFVPAYLSVLLGETGRAYLDQIIIEGHADDGGSYVYNLGLSERRAYTVTGYIFNNNLAAVPGIANPEKYISISGRSYSRPVMINGTVDKEKSRRVEFKFRLKDDELLKKIDGIIEGMK